MPVLYDPRKNFGVGFPKHFDVLGNLVRKSLITYEDECWPLGSVQKRRENTLTYWKDDEWWRGEIMIVASQRISWKAVRCVRCVGFWVNYVLTSTNQALLIVLMTALLTSSSDKHVLKSWGRACFLHIIKSEHLSLFSSLPIYGNPRVHFFT